MLDPFFVDSAGGRILCTAFCPGGRQQPGPGFLFLPPFAEEMNKSRHVLARLGHRLAGAGWTTVVPDLYGTGDSDGDFGEAGWTQWRQNAVDAARWLVEAGRAPLFVGGLRLGATLALDVLPELPAEPRSVLLWQPVAAGRTALTQFLRLRVAGSMQGAGGRETVAMLRERLAAGEPVEIGGYMLSPALYEAIEALDLSRQVPSVGTGVDWLEVSLGPDGSPLPAARQLAEAWADQGVPVTPEPVGGDAFWSTQELAGAPALIERSVQRLRERLA